MKINVFWFRRDLRLEDNTALYRALESRLPVLTLFIFDTNITDDLPADDARINFIYDTLESINMDLARHGTSILVKKGDPVEVWKKLTGLFDIDTVFAGKDYEPYGIERDMKISHILEKNKTGFITCKDHVIFEEKEILKPDGKPYTVFTPYKKAWLRQFGSSHPAKKEHGNHNYLKTINSFPGRNELGIVSNRNRVRPYDLSVVRDYDRHRDFPAEDLTSYLSPHLRFGTVSIRNVVSVASEMNQVFLGELIWREFFMQILYNFPAVVSNNFKRAYDGISWRNNESEFSRWCRGETGYPIVDAGMHQLNETGYMHNRVRMIAASFLCKHLLVDWRWGEAYFAQKLLDYELSSNNGNWQWAAGTGCDAVPYFRIFNPGLQQKKYDPEQEYVRRWTDGLNSKSYLNKIVEHEFARNRALDSYRKGLNKSL